jgi:hypothetical protein
MISAVRVRLALCDRRGRPWKSETFQGHHDHHGAGGDGGDVFFAYDLSQDRYQLCLLLSATTSASPDHSSWLHMPLVLAS